MKKILSFALSLTVLAACAQKETAEPVQRGGQQVALTITVDYPQGDPDSKVAFDQTDNTKLVWTGDEKMTLIFGKDNADGTDNKNNPSLGSPSQPGVFSGTVEIPTDYTISDLRAIVVPHECGAYFNGYNGTTSYLNIPIPNDQVQQKNNVPNWQYVPFFYDLTGVSFEENTENIYTLSGLELKSAGDLLKFNIYGLTGADEILKSVTLTINGDSNVIAGTTQWQLGSTGTGIGNSGEETATVSLEEELSVPSDSQDGLKVFLSFLSKNSRTVTNLVVETDKATYDKSFPTSGDDKITLPATSVTDFNIHLVNINLSTYKRHPFALEYSVDGGQTWKDEIPESYTSLAVKGQITSESLATIVTSINSQETAVALDLSASRYESAVFPRVFGAAEINVNTNKPLKTEGSTKIKSITFPYNVTELAAYAFAACTELQEVSLANIKKINNYVFAVTGLKTINVPSNVTYVGTYAFSYLPDATEIYFNPTISATCSGRIFPNRWKNYTSSDWNNADHPMTITMGPKCTYVESSMFDTNARLTSLVFEGDNVKFGSEWAIRAYNLRRIVFTGKPPYSGHGANIGGSAFANVTDGVIVVPDDQYDAFAAHAACVKILGLTYTDANGESAKRFTLVKASEDVE